MSLLDLNEPTDTDCDEHETNRVAIIVAGSVVGGVLLLLVVIVTACFSYLCFKQRERTSRRLNMSPEEIEALEKQNKELVEYLKDPSLSGENLKEVAKCVKKLIDKNHKRLGGDGGDNDVADNGDEEKHAN